MIDLGQAITLARQSALKVLSVNVPMPVAEIERESYNGREVLSVTLGIPRDLDALPPIARLGAHPFEYKRFLLDAETGEFVAMKLREPVSA